MPEWDSYWDDVPSVKPFLPFDTLVDGPFYVLKDPSTIITNIQSLSDAVAEFARVAVPAHRCPVAHVSTNDGVPVVGYVRPSDDAEVMWFGLKQGFDLLYQQPYIEPLEIMLAEEGARRRARPTL